MSCRVHAASRSATGWRKGEGLIEGSKCNTLQLCSALARRITSITPSLLNKQRAEKFDIVEYELMSKRIRSRMGCRRRDLARKIVVHVQRQSSTSCNVVIELATYIGCYILETSTLKVPRH